MVCANCLKVMRKGRIHTCHYLLERIGQAAYDVELEERRAEAAERNRKDAEHDRARTV